MSEVGANASVGIESVEWLAGAAGSRTVRVTGRWRRRRGWLGGETRGPTTLVIEAAGRRHRFPAMPEPPSLVGVAPGTWRLSFSVPVELVPDRDGHAWLSLGSVTVPLPVPGPAGPPGGAGAGPAPAGEAAPEGSPAGVASAETSPDEPSSAEGPPAPAPAGGAPPPDVPAASGPASLEIERAWRRADDAERTVTELAARATELGTRIAELERRLADGERRRRDAEQHAHAEEAIRRDLERRLAGGATDPAASAIERERLTLERALRARRDLAPARVPAEPRGDVVGAAPAAAIAPAETQLVRALRHELDARVAAEARLRARVVQAETGLAARVLLEQRTSAALREVRSELAELRDALDAERDRRRAAEAEAERLRGELGGQRERSREAAQAIGELRGALDRLTPASERETDAPSAATVTPERLSDALARLRESRESQDADAPASRAASLADPARPGAPAGGSAASAPGAVPAAPAVAGPATGPTLEPALRRLARRDPARAGRLLVSLAGAQGAAYRGPVAYDLVLGPGHGCVQVTVDERGTRVEREATARAREQVDLQLLGDPARLVRRVLAAPWRRLLPVGLARIRGRRDGVDALRALLGLPLDLDGLRAAGMAADTEAVVGLIAAMIEPAWTRGERFTLAVEDEGGVAVHLQILDGRSPVVTREAPAGRVATTVRGTAAQLVAAVAGGTPGTEPGPPAPAAADVRGDEGPLALLRTWVNRAQSG
jgi:hypothetical protein